MKFNPENIPKFLGEQFSEFQIVHIKKKVYKVISKDVTYRLDVGYSTRVLDLQYEMIKNGINVPKVLATKMYSNKLFKLSEWIHGSLDLGNNLEVYSLLGEQVAKLNLIKLPDGNFIGCADINSTGVVFNGKDVYIIDLGRSKVKNNPDQSVVQILLKRIKIKERIEAFLEGYSKYRSITNIRTLCEERQWKWR
jgi:tRNA A-37 threonylcarbamoyl transferase component Bud32